MIINEDFFKSDLTSNVYKPDYIEIPNAIYYQLQIIFDAIDSGPKSLFIIETFLYVLYNLKKIKVPSFDLIAASIRVKQTSLEFQRERYDKYIHLAEKQNISSKSSTNEINQIKKEINPPKSYKVRQKDINKLQNKKEELNNKEIEIDSFDSFWNSPDPCFCYDNGIIYNKLHHEQNLIKSQQYWMNEIENIQRIIKNSKGNQELKTSEFLEKKSKVRSKLFKFFYYDDNKNNWCFDPKMFDEFVNEKLIDFNNTKNPLVFILNSIEQDLIEMTSNLINDLIPEFESKDDQIFIYGLCDKSLSMLNFNINLSDTIKSSIKPVFLLLHVPKSKQKLPNLQLIIFQIYTYLYLICDLKIIILDKDHYYDQIELFKSIRNVCESIKNTKHILFDYFIPKFVEVSFRHDDNNSNNNDDDANDDDDIFEEEDFFEEEDALNIKVDDKQRNQLKSKYEKLLIKIQIKQLKIIFLVNDKTIDFSDEIHKIFIENNFFDEIKSQFQNNEVFISYINVQNLQTYEEFLNILNEILVHSKFVLNEIKNNSQCIELVKLPQAYMRIRSKLEWEEELTKHILNRYSIYESSQIYRNQLYTILSNIQKEVLLISPVFNDELNNKCSLVLSEIKMNEAKKNNELFRIELKNSSQLYLNYLEEKVNSKIYWNEEQMYFMISAYESFIKNEFLEIIQLNSSYKKISMIYENNYEILENQIKDDKIKIDDIFKSFINKINIKKTPKEQNIKDDIRKSANYAMKETENVREIKVTVQINKDLKTQIEQDF